MSELYKIHYYNENYYVKAESIEAAITKFRKEVPDESIEDVEWLGELHE
jgi:hypothetical protein